MKFKWIIIDSLMPEQLKYAPFLQSVAKNYQADFIPPLGYQEDALSFFSGQKPNQINVGPLFCYHPQTSLFSWLKSLRGCHFLDLLFFKYALVALSHLLKKERHLSKVNIPINLIYNFDIASHSLAPNNYILKIKTIFDDLVAHNKSFAFIKGSWLITDKKDKFIKNFFQHIFCRGDEKTLKLAKKYQDKDLSLIWFLELDSIVHKFGPHSQQAIEQIRKIDKWLADYLKEEEFIIHSDHGMSEIKSSINFSDILSQMPFKIGKDYLVFLDSVMARFWFFNPDVSLILKKKLEFLKMGHFLTAQEKIIFGYNFPDNRYGDEFFILDQGKMILPNYFQKKAPQAMHGYLPKDSQTGIFLSNLNLPPRNEIFYNEILTLISGFIR